jgi:hypothetical protein
MKQNTFKFYAVVFLQSLALLGNTLLGEEIVEKLTPEVEETDDSAKITYDFDVDGEQSGELAYYSGIERLFRNPAIISGLSSGAAALNRSIDSMMEVVFYRLLDNELNYDIGLNTQLRFVLRRDVFNTTTGTYVVVDQFSMGPRYLREMAKIQELPIGLHIETAANVFNIYPRTDAMRVAEKKELPKWRQMVNNWFGIVPFLTRVLPPSFNPNEMYDPLVQLTTPFLFPVKPEIFYEMPIGSIRSYAINGGISIPTDFAHLVDQNTRNSLTGKDTLQFTLPVSVFVSGEHRINVLRRSENVAWVGINHLSRAGVTATAQIGRVLTLLDKVTQYWIGVKAPFSPLEFDNSLAKALRFDQLYEFDLSKPEARKAYEAATAGDFALSYEMHLKRAELGEATGVSFHFWRRQNAWETAGTAGTNLFLIRRHRQTTGSSGEVEITDAKGRFYQLQTEREKQVERWEVLTGNQRAAVRSRGDIAVARIEDQQIKEESGQQYMYRVERDGPIQLSYHLNLMDRHVDAEEFGRSITLVRKFTGLELRSVPKIPVRDATALKAFRQLIAAENPSNEIRRLHVTPTYLGQMSINAAVVIPHQTLEAIASHDDDEIIKAFARAYEEDAEYWSRPEGETWGRWMMGHSLRMASLPLRLFGFRYSSVDFRTNFKSLIQALRRAVDSEDPEEALASLDILTHSPHPELDVQALVSLADDAEIQRQVTFHASPRGHAPKEIKDRFRSIDNKVVRNQIRIKEEQRSQAVQDKVLQFFPMQVKPQASAVAIRSVEVIAQLPPDHTEMEGTADDIPDLESSDLLTDTVTKEPQILLRLQVERRSDLPLKVYLKVEDSGEFQVGRFVIAEQVVEAIPRSIKGSTQSIELWLSGRNSVLSDESDRAGVVLKGALQVYLAVSNDGQNWSKDRLLRFRFEEGRLLPP